MGLVYRELLMASLETELRIEDLKERRETARLIAITIWGAHEDMMTRYDREDDFELNIELITVMSRVEEFCRPLFK